MGEHISAGEMAAMVQRAVNAKFGMAVADEAEGGAFELTSPATGQRFRVIVTYVSATDAVDRALAELLEPR